LPARRWPASLYLLAALAGLVLLAAVCYLAWLEAGRPVWIAGLVLGGILVVVPAFRLALDWIKRPPGAPAGWQPVSWLPRVRLPHVLYGAVLLAAWLAIGLVYAWGTVYVDNFSPHDVRIFVDGEEWTTKYARSTEVNRLRRGRHTLTVRALDTGEELDRLTVEVSGMSDHVLNVLRAQVYARGSVIYGDVNDVPLGPPPEQAEQAAWFRPNVDYLFVEPPEEIRVSVRRGEKAPLTTKTYLVRRPPLPPQKGLRFPGPLPRR
jgi:hypothetical protein